MPHSKMLLWAVVGLLHLLTFSAVSTAEDQLKSNTIVVQTPLQNYDQPTLRDYEECQANRDNCVSVCDGNQSCEDECPVCPQLYDKPLMVQGINDTDVVAPPQVPLNTTNIIRLTNEINNIIEHQIQNRNEVNVQVEQNVSQVGGRFGLGYSDHGSCCHVVVLDRECEHEGGHSCREKSRQRVCGERCQARVMLAKRVVQCDAEDGDKCHETIEYVPRRRRSHSKKSSQRAPCHYFGNNWPYFSCGQNQGQNVDVVQPPRVKRSTCQQCLNMPYGYILQSGLPAQCAGCFQGFGAPLMPMYNAPYMYNPYVPYPSFGNFPNNGNKNGNNKGYENEDNIIAGSGNDGWILCDDDNVENCLDNKTIEDSQQAPAAHQEQQSEDGQDSEEYEYGVQRRRRRRQNRRTFVRSAYSKRNRGN
ncbi:uncharacterized protein LOC128263292 [Drosophila gunungcola]|uniref:Uncharacterized protein n=1 Tax=Drosophila gunungcola TaxID=103775 RepID=A0A9P9YW14_9MUSC|nr:uncharacterized protein LOC128263292 [Drosophila gunungcola]KAI8044127.1 hypothetical protein M5D96_000278 [Drosophila gunungcola]